MGFEHHERACKLFGWNGTRERALGMDAITRALNTIDYAHHEIHGGSHYYINGWVQLEDGPGVYAVKLVTPDTAEWSHFQWAIQSSGVLLTQLHEDATGGMADGSPVTPINNNRNSAKTSSLVITGNVTANTGQGRTIDNSKWGAGGFKTTVGGGTSRSDEVILKQNTIYCRTFTSYSAANIVQFFASWYEHESKDD